MISSGVIVDWHVVALAPVCGNAPTLDWWIGGREAWTASDGEDHEDAWIANGKLPVR